MKTRPALRAGLAVTALLTSSTCRSLPRAKEIAIGLGIRRGEGMVTVSWHALGAVVSADPDRNTILIYRLPPGDATSQTLDRALADHMAAGCLTYIKSGVPASQDTPADRTLKDAYTTLQQLSIGTRMRNTTVENHLLPAILTCDSLTHKLRVM